MCASTCTYRVQKADKQSFQTSIVRFENTLTSNKEKKETLNSVLCPMVKYCEHILIKGSRCLQFTSLCTLNKLVDTGLVFDLFQRAKPDFLSASLIAQQLTASQGLHAQVRKRLTNSVDQHQHQPQQQQQGHDDGGVTPPTSPGPYNKALIVWPLMSSGPDSAGQAWDLLTVYKEIDPATSKF